MPPLEYARTEVKRASQVASAKVDIRPGQCGYILITKSGHPLPSPAESAVYFSRHYSKCHIECLVGEARKRYVEQAQRAQHQYNLEYHDWYWQRLDWEVRLVLNALRLGRNLYWPKGHPLAVVEKWTKQSLQWNAAWFDCAVRAVKKKCARLPEDRPTPDQPVNRSVSVEEEERGEPLGGLSISSVTDLCWLSCPL